MIFFHFSSTVSLFISRLDRVAIGLVTDPPCAFIDTQEEAADIIFQITIYIVENGVLNVLNRSRGNASRLP